MATKLQRNDANAHRWFATGFMAGGVQSVDAEKHTLHGAVLIRPGEAKGHGVWIDQEFCRAVAAMSSEGKSAQAGLKARFGHPNMCSEALGTFLGRWKGITCDEQGYARGDLFLSSTAAESPKGDLRKYVEEMAAKEPQHFGASIVFSMDWDAMDAFMAANTVEVKDESGKVTGSAFKSPDPANVENLPHARCAELHAADLVDDPAATDGMFAGAAGLSLAASMTEWLDTHHEVFKAFRDDPSILDIVERYSDELGPFLQRYQDNQAKKLGTVVQTTTTVWTDDGTDQAESPDAAEPAQDQEQASKAAEPDEMQAKVDAVSAQLTAKEADIARLTVERDGATVRADTAEASIKALIAERDELAARANKADELAKTLTSERDEAVRKLAAIESGAPPVSSVPAEKLRGSMWDDARKSKGK